MGLRRHSIIHSHRSPAFHLLCVAGGVILTTPIKLVVFHHYSLAHQDEKTRRTHEDIDGERVALVGKVQERKESNSRA
jgi:hypothetical protein